MWEKHVKEFFTVLWTCNTTFCLKACDRCRIWHEYVVMKHSERCQLSCTSLFSYLVQNHCSQLNLHCPSSLNVFHYFKEFIMILSYCSLLFIYFLLFKVYLNGTVHIHGHQYEMKWNCLFSKNQTKLKKLPWLHQVTYLDKSVLTLPISLCSLLVGLASNLEDNVTN